MSRFMVGALLLLLSGSPLPSAGAEPVNHAEMCGRCHRDILLAWKKSAHAHAMETRCSRMFSSVHKTLPERRSARLASNATHPLFVTPGTWR